MHGLASVLLAAALVGAEPPPIGVGVLLTNGTGVLARFGAPSLVPAQRDAAVALAQNLGADDRIAGWVYHERGGDEVVPPGLPGTGSIEALRQIEDRSGWTGVAEGEVDDRVLVPRLYDWLDRRISKLADAANGSNISIDVLAFVRGGTDFHFGLRTLAEKTSGVFVPIADDGPLTVPMAQVVTRLRGRPAAAPDDAGAARSETSGWW